MSRIILDDQLFDKAGTTRAVPTPDAERRLEEYTARAWRT